MNKQRAIIIDLDGTKLNNWCKGLIDAMRNSGARVILMTGRPSEYKNVTLAWLAQHEVKFDKLIMRLGGDCRKDDIIKEELYNRYIKDLYDIMFVVDDRKSVVNM